jgi:hypothetical protein
MTRLSRFPDRRRIAWQTILCVALLVGLSFIQPGPQVRQALAQNSKPVVHVFLQLDAKSSVVERTLQQQLPELKVTVFGRLRDFEERLTTARPDAVLSIGPILQQHAEMPALQGYRDGKSVEPYSLVSVNQLLEGPLAGKTIGVVELLGREGSQAFVNGLLKATNLKIKRVAKVEDLLSLLEFSAADGIVLPSAMLPALMERTRLVIKAKEVPGGLVGLPAVAVLNPAVRQLIVKAFQGLDAPTKHLLSIDTWRAP